MVPVRVTQRHVITVQSFVLPVELACHSKAPTRALGTSKWVVGVGALRAQGGKFCVALVADPAYRATVALQSAPATVKLDAIIRQSRTSEQARSPDDQRRTINEWAAARDVEIVAEHVGLGLSGKTMDRAGIEEAVQRIRQGASEGVVVAFLDRFSRAPTDAALAVCREIERAGGKFFPIDLPNVDLSTPVGEFVLTMMLATARMQWRQTADRYERTRRRAISEGKAVGGAPFGYSFRDPTPKGEQGVVDSRLVPDANAPIVRELFERKAGGATWLELSRWLDQAAPKDDRKLWARSTVSGMIASKTYLGEVSSGPYRLAGAHEPIVSPSLWRRAQNGAGRRTPRGTYLLSGLARCASCGRTLRGSTTGKKPRKDRKVPPPRVYLCANRQCEARSTIISRNLDNEVVRQFFSYIGKVEAKRVADADIEDARREVAARMAEVESLAAVVPKHPTAVAAHQEALGAAEEALEAAEDRLDQLVPVEGVDVRELEADWPDMDLATQREILRGAVESVDVRRAPHPGAKVPVSERIQIHWRST